MSDKSMRSCNKCRQDKPATLEFFGVNRKMPLGIQYTCRPCDANRKRKAQIDHPERTKAYSAKRVAKRLATDPEAFRAENAERAKRWREANPERAAAVKRRHLQAHPEKNQEWVNRYRARKLDATVEVVDYEAIAERDQNVCHICGFDVDLQATTYDPMARTFDHVIPLSRGGAHSMENVKVAHRLCNIRKNNRFIAVVS